MALAGDVTAIVDAYHGDPFRVLGPHPIDDGVRRLEAMRGDAPYLGVARPGQHTLYRVSLDRILWARAFGLFLRNTRHAARIGRLTSQPMRIGFGRFGFKRLKYSLDTPIHAAISPWLSGIENPAEIPASCNRVNTLSARCAAVRDLRSTTSCDKT